MVVLTLFVSPAADAARAAGGPGAGGSETDWVPPDPRCTPVDMRKPQGMPAHDGPVAHMKQLDQGKYPFCSSYGMAAMVQYWMHRYSTNPAKPAVYDFVPSPIAHGGSMTAVGWTSSVMASDIDHLLLDGVRDGHPVHRRSLSDESPRHSNRNPLRSIVVRSFGPPDTKPRAHPRGSERG